jgi:hypothetical protein
MALVMIPKPFPADWQLALGLLVVYQGKNVNVVRQQGIKPLSLFVAACWAAATGGML